MWLILPIRCLIVDIGKVFTFTLAMGGTFITSVRTVFVGAVASTFEEADVFSTACTVKLVMFV